jgi:hypothetical protein
MKVFYFTGFNENSESGVSSKLWKVERDRRRVSVWWGPVAVTKRRVIPTGRLQQCWTFSGTEATLFETKRIHSKEVGAYERRPRWRS